MIRRFRCDAVPAPGRRSVMLAVGLAALLPAARARASIEGPGVAELVGTDGAPSARARSLAAGVVTVRGYLSPSLDGREFSLSEQPSQPCQLCGATHDLGASLAVRTAQPQPGAPALQEVVVSGRLQLSPEFKLTDATIGAA